MASSHCEDPLPADDQIPRARVGSVRCRQILDLKARLVLQQRRRPLEGKVGRQALIQEQSVLWALGLKEQHVGSAGKRLKRQVWWWRMGIEVFPTSLWSRGVEAGGDLSCLFLGKGWSCLCLLVLTFWFWCGTVQDYWRKVWMYRDLYALDKIGLKYGRFYKGWRASIHELLTRSIRLPRLFIHSIFSIHMKVGYINYHTIRPWTNVLQLITGYSSNFWAPDTSSLTRHFTFCQDHMAELAFNGLVH